MITPVITEPRTFTVTTKRGDRKTVQSTLTHEEAADVCAKLDSDFARDLALAFREWKTGKRRLFSGPQAAWLQILANEELGRRQEHARGGDFVGTDEQVDAIFRLFGAAGAKLKWPKIRLSASHLEQGEQVLRDYALYVAGAKSAHPGWLAVKEKDGYTVGHLSTDGFFFWHPRAEQARHKGLLPLLRELATDPLKTAREYGGLTGNCCFCGLPLTDPRSTEQGFGPVCAENWHLPWGGKREPVPADARPTPENAPPSPADPEDEEVPVSDVPVLSTGSLTYRDGTFSAFASDLFAGARHFPQELDVRSERTGDVKRFTLQDVHKDREGDTTHVSYRGGELLLTVFND